MGRIEASGGPEGIYRLNPLSLIAKSIPQPEMIDGICGFDLRGDAIGRFRLLESSLVIEKASQIEVIERGGPNETNGFAVGSLGLGEPLLLRQFSARLVQSGGAIRGRSAGRFCHRRDGLSGGRGAG